MVYAGLWRWPAAEATVLSLLRGPAPGGDYKPDHRDLEIRMLVLMRRMKYLQVFYAPGISNPTTAPSRLNAKTSPPCCATISLTIDRPNPDPGSVRASVAR